MALKIRVKEIEKSPIHLAGECHKYVCNICNIKWRRMLVFGSYRIILEKVEKKILNL